MKKVLVYMNQNELTPTGGPSGYNHALKQELDKMGITNIHYLDSPPSKWNKYQHTGRSIKGTWYGDFLKSFKDFIKFYKYIYCKSKSPINLNDYDAIHFHDSITLYKLRDELNTYKGKIIFTSHSPSVLYKELLSTLTKWEQKHMIWFYNRMERCDEYAFKRADYLIFPCEEAEDPYYHSWNKFADIKKEKKDSFRYLLTGTNKRKAKLSKKEVCAKYHIPDNAFIVSYAGRHNELKGFDLLKEIGTNVLSKIPNAYFLIAGAEDPIKGLKHDRWVEVGWTDDPHSIIAASDCFVLPNRETYFDLIMLEVLSLGTIVVASNTGGNKHFKNDRGVFLYDNIDKAVSTIKYLSDLHDNDIANLKIGNEKLFDKYYDINIFASNYIHLINSLDLE